jgi:P4 family phage/plasmid primase-like protien
MGKEEFEPIPTTGLADSARGHDGRDEAEQEQQGSDDQSAQRAALLVEDIEAKSEVLKALRKDLTAAAKDHAEHDSATTKSRLDSLTTRAAKAHQELEEAEKEHLLVSKPNSWYDLNDIGNGQRFAAQHAGMIKFSFEVDRWFGWNKEGVWFADKGAARGQVHRLAKETVLDMKDQATRLMNPWRKWLASHANSSASEASRAAMVASARSEEHVATKPDVFDPDNHLLNCKNSIIDLRTGERLEHDREKMMTMMCDAKYERGYRHPQLDAYLRDTFRARDEDEHGPSRSEKDAEELRDAIQRLVGMTALCKGPSADLGPILYGPGGTGKGTFTDFLALTLGTYATKIKSDALMQQKGDGRFDLWRHATSRCVYSQEIGDKRKFDSERWKSWVSGDMQEFERKYQDQFQAKPKATLWLATNFLPEADARDTGMRRRLVIVPFNNVPKKVDRNLRAAIAQDSDLRKAFLWYIVEGAMKFLERPLSIDNLPREMRLATNEYWQRNDKVEEWLDEFEFSPKDARKRSPDWFMATADLRQSYARKLGAVVDDRMLKKLLEDRGAANGKLGKGRVRGYLGIRERRHGDFKGIIEVSGEARQWVLAVLDGVRSQKAARIDSGDDPLDDTREDPRDDPS